MQTEFKYLSYEYNRVRLLNLSHTLIIEGIIDIDDN